MPDLAIDMVREKLWFTPPSVCPAWFASLSAPSIFQSLAPLVFCCWQSSVTHTLMFPSPTYIDSIVTLVLLLHCELAAFSRVNFFQPGLQWARSHPSDKGCRVSQAPVTTEPLLPFSTWPLLHCMTLLLLLSVSNQRTHSSSLSATKYWRFLQSVIFRYRSGNLHIYYHYIKGGLHPNTDALPISRSFNNGQTPLLYGSWKKFSSEKKKLQESCP